MAATIRAGRITYRGMKTMTENKQNPDAREHQNPAAQGQQDSPPQDGENDTQILVPSGRRPTLPNALVHGLYATDIVLPWESKEDFERLWRDLKEEWLPKGRQEYETVLSLAHMNWVKHRLMRTTQLAFRRDPFLSELQKQGVKTWEEVSKFIARKAAEEDAIKGEVLATVKILRSVLVDASKLMATNPQSPEIKTKLDAVHKLFSQDRVRIYNKFYRKKPNAPELNDSGENFYDVYDKNQPTSLIEEAYHPDYLTKLVRLESSIDARIDKILHRLMAMKEYKRIVKESRFGKTPAIAPSNPK